jgi:multisite-specific tRNA:(cytosine-C5)-methyltransferase
MRIYPHLQDSGGFFVAVLRRKVTNPPATSDRKRAATEETSEEPESKKARLDAEQAAFEVVPPEEDSPMAVEGAETPVAQENRGETPATKKEKQSTGNGSFKEQPYTYISPTDPVLLSCL